MVSKTIGKRRAIAQEIELTMQPQRRAERGQFAKELPPFGNFAASSRFDYVQMDRLFVDNYQRGEDRRRVPAMSHYWDQDLAGVPVVNERGDGRIAIIDGQQRVAALQRMENCPTHIFAQIFTGLTYEQESTLYYKLDTQRASLTQTALFRARIEAKEPIALEIVEIAESVGVTAKPSLGAAPNNLRAYGTLLTLHRRAGKVGLRRILRVAANAWPGSKYLGSSTILLGLETFFNKYPEANDKHLIETLNRTTPQIIEARGKTMSQAMSSTLGPWIARVMLTMYNSGMRKNRLPDWE